MRRIESCILLSVGLALLMVGGGCAPAPYHDEIVIFVPVPYPVPDWTPCPVPRGPDDCEIHTQETYPGGSAIATKIRERHPAPTRGDVKVEPVTKRPIQIRDTSTGTRDGSQRDGVKKRKTRTR